LGSSGGRIDHSLSTYHNVLFYYNTYPYELKKTDIFMISKASMSVFVKNGESFITPSTMWQKLEEGYSIIPMIHTATVSVTELLNEEETYSIEKELKFGVSIYFRKKPKMDKLKITVVPTNSKDKVYFLYSCTTTFHKKK